MRYVNNIWGLSTVHRLWTNTTIKLWPSVWRETCISHSTQFAQKIHILRYYNAKEYTSSSWRLLGFHIGKLLLVLRYLKIALGLGILYRSNGHLWVEGFTDADWVGSPLDRRSTTGYCTFFGDTLVTWKSEKHIVLAWSSAKAEYRAMAYTACELTWLQNFLQEIGSSTRLLYILRLTHFFMKGPSILRLIVILFETRYSVYIYTIHKVWRPVS
jgi:hypothetical protein